MPVNLTKFFLWKRTDSIGNTQIGVSCYMPRNWNTSYGAVTFELLASYTEWGTDTVDDIARIKKEHANA